MAANASLTLTCTQSSQDIANNKSTVSIKVVCQLKNGVSFSNAGIKTNVSITCDGQTKTFAAPTSYNVGANGSLTLGTVSFTVSHASDGKKSINYSGSWTPPYLYGGGTATGSGSKTLTTIPRKSTFTFPSTITLGTAYTFNITRQSTSFTHDVYYKLNGGSWVRLATGVATSYSWTPPLSLASNYPNQTSFMITVAVNTLSGSTMIYNDPGRSVTVNIPSSIVPSISGPSISRVDNGVPASWGIYVRYFSKANVSISGSGSYGSNISAYSLSGGGYSSGSSSLATGTLNEAGTVTFAGTVRDSRGRTKSASASVTVVDYWWPSASIVAERCNSNGTANPDGVYVKVTANFAIAPVSSKNSVSSKKIEIAGTSYTNTTFGSGGYIILGGALSVDKSYIAKVTVTDALGQSALAQTTIPTGQVTVDYKSGGKGVAFGKVAETDNQLESAWSIKCNKALFVAEDVVIGGSPMNIFRSTGLNNNIVGNYYGAFYTGYGAGAGDNYLIGINSNGQLIGATALNNNGWVPRIGCMGGTTSYAGTIQFSTSQWLGFLDYYGGTRRAWIGHDGTNNLKIVNEYDKSGVYIRAYKSGNNYDVALDASGDVCFLPNASNNIYLGGSYNRWKTMYAVNSCNISSDRKQKKDIINIDSACEFILRLNPVQFRRKDGDTGRIHYGFIAQDVASLANELEMGDLSLYQASWSETNEDEKGEKKTVTHYYDPKIPDEKLQWGLTYEEFIAPMVATIQHHQKDIEKLTDRVRKLEELVSTLISK